MNKDTQFLIDLVKEASLLINEDMHVQAKGNKGDLVTNFDYEIEKFIISKINESYPNFTIISEEFNADNHLTQNCFTIDPIDGTINFAHNIPLWGIQVACIKNGETISAVIYLPVFNELYYADETGAYLNGNIINVNTIESDRGIYTIEGPNRTAVQIEMQKINTNCRGFYCAAVDFAWVACGRLSGTIFTYDSFWDYVPGQYLVKQAGGVISNDIKAHGAANTNEFLQTLKDNMLSSDNEKIIVKQ